MLGIDLGIKDDQAWDPTGERWECTIIASLTPLIPKRKEEKEVEINASNNQKIHIWHKSFDLTVTDHHSYTRAFTWSVNYRYAILK